MSSNYKHESLIYVGPAALCPKSAENRHLIVITGDKSKWARKLIEKRTKPDENNEVKVQVIVGTIGKSGTQKKWHCFNDPILNGTLSEDLIGWSTEESPLESLNSEDIECIKIDDILNDENSGNTFSLAIAQGDPFLMIKRSKKILHKIKTIDLSLHPLALVWEDDINTYLAEQKFVRYPSNQLTWQRQSTENHVEPLATPPESRCFLSGRIQELIYLAQVNNINKDHPNWSNLYLIRQIAIGAVSTEKNLSLLQKTASKIANLYKSKLKQRNQEQPDQFVNQTYHDDHYPIVVESKLETNESAPVPVARGHIDGFDQSMELRGWVDASNFGPERSDIQITWKEHNAVIGRGSADIDRPDLIAAGISNGQCGFSISIESLNRFNLIAILDETITLDIVESKSGQLINGESWIMTNSVKNEIIDLILEKHLLSSESKELKEYFEQARNHECLTSTRKYLIAYTALQCQIGNWNKLPIEKSLASVKRNPLLNYGVDSESAHRLELTLFAVIKLIQYLDQDQIHESKPNLSGDNIDIIPQLKELSNQLTETCYVSLQEWEMRIWSRRVRPLLDTLIATIFLQGDSRRLDEVSSLFESLALIAQSVYASPGLSFQLRTLIDLPKNYLYKQEDVELDRIRNDHFGMIAKIYSNNIQKKSTIKDFTYYASVSEFASQCPAIYKWITKKYEECIDQYRRENNRKSKANHWTDRLGIITNQVTQNLVRDLIDHNFARKDIISVHSKMILVKKNLAELLFERKEDRNMTHNSTSLSIPKRWLIIGEKNLAQCWIYRVEQKKQQLEELGYEVRCMDWHELRFWSATNDLLWADSLIVCRLPAFYSVFRAMAFARTNGKKIYAEIDDLIFTPEYPAEYSTYGGTISRSQFNNLSIDYILRIETMNYSDEVIVSTKALAEHCMNALDDPNKPIHILPNLPLESLCDMGGRYEEMIDEKFNKDELNIILTSGTLSHKQILNETIFPVLRRILEKYQHLIISTIGHITLPSYFNQFQERIISIPFTDYDSYLNSLSQGNIALVPLEKHATTDGKSAIKWMEASYCGVPCICSPVRAYTDVTEDGQDVFIAKNAEQWEQMISHLIDQTKTRRELTNNAFKSAKQQFNNSVGIDFWKNILKKEDESDLNTSSTKKVLLINVYFAPQSVGGATRVAQDYVKAMLNDPKINWDVTVLCTEYDHWHSDHGQKRPHKKRTEDAIPLEIIQTAQQKSDIANSYGADLQTLREINRDIDMETAYKESISVDVSSWHGARVVRLNIDGKPWSCHEDKVVEEFCKDFFSTEQFDEIQCHCCQVITASPLIVAERMNIPYDIVMHDAWWMSPEQFLVSNAGKIIDPSDPLGHFDHDPNEDEINAAMERREFLFEILKKARKRIAVSECFAKICESGGIEDVSVQVNTFTPMTNAMTPTKSSHRPYRVCHIGGMSLHKGYQLLRNAVNSLPEGIPLVFTIIDHRLSTTSDNYSSTWNGYEVKFTAPIAMNEMPDFYHSQDVLVAPSIWPESFGLVTREALSAGLWVIASDSGALAEPLKTDASKGVVVRPNHIQDLVDALKAIPCQLD